jgi:diguanylate cyclase (GGDEF)-like protein
VMMVDVDHFKALNDTAGHAEGDQCLQQIAATLRAQVRADLDLVARYGGEEFVVILPSANMETALLVAERVRAAVEGLRLPNPGLSDGRVVTVSIGLAAVAAADGTASPQALLQAADVALYAAKATGRNYVCGHSDDATLMSVADAPAL